MNFKDLKSKEQVFEEINKYLIEQIKLAQREMESKESYSSPSWALTQADRMGTLRALKKMYKLIPDQGKK